MLTVTSKPGQKTVSSVLIQWNSSKNLSPKFKTHAYDTYDSFSEVVKRLRLQKLVPFLYTVGLNMPKTLKKMLAQAKHIFDTFEYF